MRLLCRPGRGAGCDGAPGGWATLPPNCGGVVTEGYRMGCGMTGRPLRSGAALAAINVWSRDCIEGSRCSVERNRRCIGASRACSEASRSRFEADRRFRDANRWRTEVWRDYSGLRGDDIESRRRLRVGFSVARTAGLCPRRQCLCGLAGLDDFEGCLHAQRIAQESASTEQRDDRCLLTPSSLP